MPSLLEKGKGQADEMEISSVKPALEKAPRVVLQARRPIVVIDWHNTLEKNNVVTAAALTGLEQLLDHCTVHILSFVQTWSRQQAVYWDTQQMLPSQVYRRLAGIHTCWQWVKYLGGECIFDDAPEIIDECRGAGIRCYAICSRHCQHNSLPSSMVFTNFGDAAGAYLDYLESR